MTRWKAVSERICRYCGNGYSATTFKKDAHVIPRFMGNAHLLCDDECDSCNELFATYETDLSYYLGITPLFSGLDTGFRIPKFKSPGEKLIVEPKMINGAKTLVFSDKDRRRFIIGEETTKIRYNKPSFVPVHIYKALLKFALAILPHDEIKQYKPVIDFLLINKFEHYFSPLAKIAEFNLIGKRIAVPYCFLFKKHDGQPDLPKHIFQLYFGSMVFELFIPFHQMDAHIYNNPNGSLPPVCPPLLFSPIKQRQTVRKRIADLSSSEKVTNEFDELTFEYSPNNRQNIGAVDPETGEELVFKPEEIINIAYIPKGTVLPIKNNNSNFEDL